MKIAGIMTHPRRSGNFKDENLEEAVALVSTAADAGADIAVTYEQFLDGYGRDGNKMIGPDDPDAGRCEVIEESDYVSALGKLAEESGIAIVAGMATREDDQTYNSALVWDRDGSWVGRYRKTHNANRRAHWFDALNEEEQIKACSGFAIDVGRIGIKICNDRHFSETTKYLIEDGSEIILCPSFGTYDPSRLVDDSRDFGVWAVFVHPEGCQFINRGTVVREQKAEEGRVAICQVGLSSRRTD